MKRSSLLDRFISQSFLLISTAYPTCIMLILSTSVLQEVPLAQVLIQEVPLAQVFTMKNSKFPRSFLFRK